MSTANYSNGKSRSSEDIHQDIQHTRQEMDSTLDRLGSRLDPRNMLDDFLHMFQGDDQESTVHKVSSSVKSASASITDLVREHPGPALLCGAGAVWWMIEQSQSSGTSPTTPTSRKYPEATWHQEVPAWHDGYDWNRSSHGSQENWNAQADQVLADIQASAEDESLPAGERMRMTASKLLSLSGHKRRDIHARWASLKEHSGSFVDCRTGEPYDSSYGAGWKHLAMCDAIASDYEAAHAEPDSESANSYWDAVKTSLSDTKASTKQKLQRAAEAISGYAAASSSAVSSWGNSVSNTASDWAHNVGQQTSAAGKSMGAMAGRARQNASTGAAATQQQLKQGVQSAQQNLATAVEEYPLAVGAACLGIGLLAGLLIPRTRREDELLGEASDELKADAEEMGREALQRGQQIASETATAAMDEAERQGITPEQIGKSTREAMANIQDKVTESTQDSDSAPAKAADKLSSVAERAADTAKSRTADHAQDMQSKNRS